MAFLDLLAKDSQQSVETLLGSSIKRKEYNYSAILGDCNPKLFHKMYQYYRQRGFTDFKIKLSGDSKRDRSKLEIIKGDNSAVTVRADANNLWQSNEQAIKHLSILDFQFSSIEEPLKTTKDDMLSSFVKDTGIKIVLDENFLRYEQIHPLLNNSNYWIVNLRVSKLGGLIRSLKIVNELIKYKISINVGAQVGETSLLTRAALIIADAANNRLLAQEGAFSTHLLKTDPFTPNIKFGYGGKLKLSHLSFRNSHGFGMEATNMAPFGKQNY